MKAKRNLSFPVLVCFVLSNISLKCCGLFLLRLPFNAGEVIPSRHYISQISDFHFLPATPTYMLFLFTFRKSNQFPETESKPHTVIHEGAEHKETVETWNPPIITFILTKFPPVFMHLK